MQWIFCTWHPWEYHYRIKITGKVALEKEKIESKKVSKKKSTRNQVLNYIREQGSQQQSEPITGNIDLGLAEPLHNANNPRNSMHLLILQTALSK